MVDLPSEKKFDFIFIDADKPSNVKYFTEAKRLIRKGGVIVSVELRLIFIFCLLTGPIFEYFSRSLIMLCVLGALPTQSSLILILRE